MTDNAPTRPNIILLSLIPLRAANVSAYGYGRQTTPYLDQVAGEGALFEQAYTTSCWTPPAHASLLTGLYPSQHGVMGSAGLSDAVPTMPALLQEAGYHTVAFTGNPHVGSFKRFHRGFQEFYERGRLIPAGAAAAHREPAPKTPAGSNPAGLTLPQAIKDAWRILAKRNKYHHGEQITREALAWLADPGREKQPFFLFCEYSDLHHPYRISHRDRQLFPFPPGSRLTWRIRRLNENPYLYMTGMVPAQPADFELLKALYDSGIYALDRQVGRLLDGLRQQGLLDNSLLIILSPHGENIGEHGLGAHQSNLYEPVLRVPVIMRYPPQIPAGRRIPALVQLTDILPTVLTLAGIDHQDLPLSGTSLLPLDPGRTYRNLAIAEWAGRPPGQLMKLPVKWSGPYIAQNFQRHLRMIRQGDYKYIDGSDGGTLLFNLSDDPGEQNNLAAAMPGRVKAMAAQLEKALSETAAYTGEPDPEHLEPALADLLRAGGYKI